MKETIKNIIFDFGGVVFQIDEKKAESNKQITIMAISI